MIKKTKIVQAIPGNSHLIGIFQRLGSVCLLLTVVLAPLAVAPFAQDQVMIAKLLTLRVLVALAASFWLISKLIGGFSVKWHKAFGVILVFLGFAAVSSILSISPLTSLFGRYLRYEGFLTLLMYAAIFFLAVQFFGEGQNIERFAKWVVGGAVLVSLYGIAQYAGLDPLRWGTLSFEKTRIFSTFGNPILLGGYLAVALTFAIGLLLSERRPVWVAVWSAGFAIIALPLIATLSRGAWMAAFVGVVLLVLFSITYGETRRRSVVFAGSAACLLVLGVLALLTVGGKTPLGLRLASIADPLGGSGASRVEIWKSAVAMIEKRPLFGFGPDTFRLAFPRYETLASARLFPETLTDNAHNVILQTAATLGIPALLAFLYAVFLCLVEFYRDHRRDFLSATVAISLLVYFIQGFLNVTAVGVAFLPWLFMGVLVAPKAKTRVVDFGAKVPAVALTLLAALSIIGSAVSFTADVISARGIVALGSGRVSSSVGLLTKAVSFNPWRDEYRRELGKAWLAAAESEGRQEYFEASRATLAEALKLSPEELDTYITLGESLTFGGETYDRTYYKQAVVTLKKAVAIRKYSPSAHRIMGYALLGSGDARNALSEVEAALEINPHDARAFLYAGEAHEKLGEKKEAREAYRVALRIAPNLPSAKKALGRLEKNL